MNKRFMVFCKLRKVDHIYANALTEVKRGNKKFDRGWECDNINSMDYDDKQIHGKLGKETA